MQEYIIAKIERATKIIELGNEIREESCQAMDYINEITEKIKNGVYPVEREKFIMAELENQFALVDEDLKLAGELLDKGKRILDDAKELNDRYYGSD